MWSDPGGDVIEWPGAEGRLPGHVVVIDRAARRHVIGFGGPGCRSLGAM